jgi:hypothetical protein
MGVGAGLLRLFVIGINSGEPAPTKCTAIGILQLLDSRENRDI